MKLTQQHLDDYIGLILWCCSKHSATAFCSHYDMLSAGKLGLTIALKKYDKSKGVPLKNWVFRFIRSQIIKARYKNNKEYREDNGLDETYNNVESDTLSPIDTIINEEDQYYRNDDVKLIMQVLNSRQYDTLTKDNNLNKNIYVDRMIKGMRITDLTHRYNMSYASISHRISRITQLIKIELGVIRR